MSREEILALLVKVQEELVRLQKVNAELRQENARLKEQMAALKGRLGKEERSAKRQAAPFSKGKRKGDPKKPGRKAGQGTFNTRDLSSKEEITEVIDVRLATACCPRCGSTRLEPVRVESVYRTPQLSPAD